ncbi:hypothetical protein [Acetobacter sp.]|uniref:hypothetical protein n=1 Tax=Acetobacter sp. TaxID=440 RepID=UPI0039EBC38B
MKKVTFTGPCSGIGAVYNKGDVAVFADDIAARIVASELGTAEDMPEPKLPKGKAVNAQPPAGDDPPAGSGASENPPPA